MTTSTNDSVPCHTFSGRSSNDLYVGKSSTLTWTSERVKTRCRHDWWRGWRSSLQTSVVHVQRRDTRVAWRRWRSSTQLHECYMFRPRRKDPVNCRRLCQSQQPTCCREIERAFSVRPSVGKGRIPNGSATPLPQPVVSHILRLSSFSRPLWLEVAYIYTVLWTIIHVVEESRCLMFKLNILTPKARPCVIPRILDH